MAAHVVFQLAPGPVTETQRVEQNSLIICSLQSFQMNVPGRTEFQIKSIAFRQ